MHKLDLKIDPADSGADFVLDADTGPVTHRILVAVRSSGQPRYAREAVALLLMQSGRSPGSAYPVFAAPFISKAAAEICLQAGAGHIDLAGNCRLAFDGIYIERQGRPNRFVSKRALRSLYETRSSRVLRALLFDPNLKWKLADLSVAAGVSIGQVFNVKKALVEREWAVFDKEGLKPAHPERILRDWGRNYTCKKNALYNFHSPEPPAELEDRLGSVFSEMGLRHALTSFSASSRLASTARQADVYAYIEGDVALAAASAKLEPAGPGSRVTLMRPYDEGVFFGTQEVEGIPVVSPIQAYLDLAGLEGNGTEEAELLLSRVILPEWRHGEIRAGN
ncbi:MAG: hypothetical protein JW793_00075 [Acidobacteria bacterium]|nr:hypothetical protein [Acidobacteriota bacterium]